LTSFVVRRQMIVEFGHCDPAGMVSPERLFEYFDSGTWSLFEAALGIGRADFIATYGIFPSVEVRLACQKTLKFGDTIEMTSRIAEFRRSSFDVAHRITIDGALAAEGSETRVWAARDKSHPQRIRALAVPADVVARFGQA
jgi:4-hydroxybenzoyl-CoA thioesterase